MRESELTICARRDITVSIVKASSTLLCVLVSMMLLAINSLILYYGHVERERDFCLFASFVV